MVPFLRIHDAQLIYEDFGYKGGTEKKADIYLKKGLHPFRLYLSIKKQEKSGMDMEWSGPGLPKEKILGKYFFRNK